MSMRAQGQKRYYALNPQAAGRRRQLAGDVRRRPGGRRRQLRQPAEAPADQKPRPPRTLRPALRRTCRPRRQLAAAGRGACRRRPRERELSPAVVIPGGTAAPSDDTVPQQIGRTVGRAATKAADLLANLPKFGRKK